MCARAECGGRGALQCGLCHCDEGYETPVDDNTTCVAQGRQGSRGVCVGGSVC